MLLKYPSTSGLNFQYLLQLLPLSLHSYHLCLLRLYLHFLTVFFSFSLVSLLNNRSIWFLREMLLSSSFLLLLDQEGIHHPLKAHPLRSQLPVCGSVLLCAFLSPADVPAHALPCASHVPAVLLHNGHGPLLQNHRFS